MLKMWLQAMFLSSILTLVVSKELKGLSGVPETRKNIPNIGGGVVHLGDLYDGRKDMVLTPKNFYKPATIQDNLMNSSALDSTTEFFVSESFLDRVDTIDIDASLKLSFMGGLIHISGSAGYLHDEHLTENTVETTLKFSSTTLQQQLPYGLELDNQDLCELVSTDGPEKPTHVVSEVIYGLNAYMQFTKKFRNQTEKKSIEGHLGVVINSIPQFAIEGEANINFTEAETEVKRTMRLTWHGDTLIDPPTTFEEAVLVYKGLKDLAEESRKVVMFSLAPITDYCSDTDTILNAISTANVALVAKMQDDFHRISMKIKDLMTTTVADGYPRYQKVLTFLKIYYDDFKNSLLLEIQKVLPGIRGGGENESELTKIINDYQTSPYFFEHADNFLGVRTRELDTIANVLAKAEEGSSITIDFGDTGEGNICIQDHEYSIMYILRVLPIENIAEDYANTLPGMWDESDKWFYNTSEVAYTGSVLRDFMEFHDSNLDRDDICYLIRLELEDKEMAASQLRIQHERDVITDDFHPPTEITQIFDEVRGWSAYNLTLSFPPNEFLTKMETKIYAVTDGEGPEDSRSRFVNLEELATKVRINLKGLKPNYIYAVTFYLWTDYGKGPASEEYLLETLPCDPPSLVHLISASPNSMSLSWSRPNNIAINVTLDEVHWKLTQNQQEISNGFITNGSYPMQVELNYLQPAENLLFHVKAKSSEIKLTEWRDGLYIETSIESEWVIVPVSTLPAKLPSLNLESTTETSITVTWSPFGKIADGAKFLYYKLKVYRESYETETNVTSQEPRHAITGLAAGEKYQICVMTVTTKGDSPFSDILPVATNDLNITQLEQLKEALGINIINDNIDSHDVRIGGIQDDIGDVQDVIDSHDLSIADNSANIVINTANVAKNAADIAYLLACNDYTILDDAERSRNYNNGYASPPCDQNIVEGDWKGGDSWYRFQEPAGTQLADSIVPSNHCGTAGTGWLNGAHPVVLGENVMRQVCFNYIGNSCWGSTNVEIKNCGGYYLYKFKATPNCNMKYCGQ